MFVNIVRLGIFSITRNWSTWHREKDGEVQMRATRMRPQSGHLKGASFWAVSAEPLQQDEGCSVWGSGYPLTEL